MIKLEDQTFAAFIFKDLKKVGPFFSYNKPRYLKNLATNWE